MTSHREAPKISKDPVADNTDLYAFVSPDQHDKVTILANYIPLEEPAGGPNFNSFGDDVLYEIMIDNDRDGIEDITYQFRFNTVLETPNSFLYNTGQITSLSDKNWNMKQFYSVTKVLGPRRIGNATLLNSNPLPTPPVNIGPRSTPNYKALADTAVKVLDDGSTVFAGQRNEAFFVDLGSIFDLAALRPLEGLHLIPIPGNAPGVDATKGYNVHTIAIQVPKRMLTSDGSDASNPAQQTSVIGVWASASRRQATVLSGEEEADEGGTSSAVQTGPFTQVSRLGMPLINEVIIPLGKKDIWNTTHPRFDSQFLQFYQTPELQRLLPVLYPGKFMNLAAVTARAEARADLVAILLTGVPPGVIPGFPGNSTGTVQADYLRLNMGIPPASTPSPLGILGGDIAGFPNGRRIADDVVNIELRAIAGLTLPFVDPSFVPDAAAGLLDQGIAGNPTQFIDFPADVVTTATLQSFPYLPYPAQGYEHSHDS